MSRTRINYEQPLEIRFMMTELFGECIMRSPSDSMRIHRPVCALTCVATGTDDTNDFCSQRGTVVKL